MEVRRNEQSMYHLWQGSNGRQHGQPFRPACLEAFPAESSHGAGRNEWQGPEDPCVRQVSQEAESYGLIQQFDQ
jgi:hypothetical protein